MNRKKYEDYIMIILVRFVHSQRLDGLGFVNEVRPTCFPKTIAFISKCFNWDE